MTFFDAMVISNLQREDTVLNFPWYQNILKIKSSFFTWTFFGQDPTVSRNSLEVWLLSHQEDHIAVLLAVDQRRGAERFDILF
jgi:hypothetical protein